MKLNSFIFKDLYLSVGTNGLEAECHRVGKLESIEIVGLLMGYLDNNKYRITAALCFKGPALFCVFLTVSEVFFPHIKNQNSLQSCVVLLHWNTKIMELIESGISHV